MGKARRKKLAAEIDPSAGGSPKPAGWHYAQEPYTPRTADDDSDLVVVPSAPTHCYCGSSVRLLDVYDLYDLLHNELWLCSAPDIVDTSNGTLIAPIWVGALLTWVRCCYDRETYDYRWEAIREIVQHRHETGLHETIEVTWRLGGRVAVFDFLRTIY